MTDAEVRRGMLMLRPQNVVLLNGQARSSKRLPPLHDCLPPRHRLNMTHRAQVQ